MFSGVTSYMADHIEVYTNFGNGSFQPLFKRCGEENGFVCRAVEPNVSGKFPFELPSPPASVTKGNKGKVRALPCTNAGENIAG